MLRTNLELIERLVGRFPVLEPLLREHRDRHFGDVLPHLFLTDVTRYVVTTFDQGGDTAPLAELIDELDEAFTAGPQEISELIAMSFLENLPREGDPGDGVRTLLSPRLRSYLRMG